ncbi:MAG: coenzyme F420-0:L-glutamate ligase [Candidatus Peribacteraceae bacterium]
MQLLPIVTPILAADDALTDILLERASFEEGDILALSSKAVATTEGAAIALETIEPSAQARELAAQCGQTPQMRQAMLDETARMHGTTVGQCPYAVLTELRPDGLTQGTIMAASAGIDHSNVPAGFVVGWPRDPVASAHRIRQELLEKTGKNVAVVITDSCCRPRRLGVAAIALTVSGFDPIRDMRGQKDLFGKELQMTQEALADQLATAANILMGNAGQSTPAVIIRDHHIPFSDFEGWVPGIEPEEDLFRGVV